jgi:hypothetical protein
MAFTGIKTAEHAEASLAVGLLQHCRHQACLPDGTDATEAHGDAICGGRGGEEDVGTHPSTCCQVPPVHSRAPTQADETSLNGLERHADPIGKTQWRHRGRWLLPLRRRLSRTPLPSQARPVDDAQGSVGRGRFLTHSPVKHEPNQNAHSPTRPSFGLTVTGMSRRGPRLAHALSERHRSADHVHSEIANRPCLIQPPP